MNHRTPPRPAFMPVACVLMCVLLVPIIAAGAGCAALRPREHPAVPLARFEFTRVQMGVQSRVVLYAPSRAAAASAAAAAFARIADLDAQLSDYRPDSELMRLCARAGQGPVPVSPDLLHLLQLSTRLSDRTAGAFDVTVGPVVALWRQARRLGALPHPARLAAARSLVNWRDITIDPAASTVSLRQPGMSLDLGGIAKGYAAHQALDLLHARGFSRSLVALAGDIAVGDPPPAHPGWTIQLSHHPHSLSLANAAVSTSGDTEQFIELDAVRYSHILDPRTGLGLTSRLAVTVIAPRGETADALASALSVTGPTAAPALLRHYPGARAIFTFPDGARATFP